MSASSAPQAQASRAAFTSDSALTPPSKPPTTDVRPAHTTSVRSRRSKASGIAKLKRLEYEAALQMAELKADLIKKKLAADVAAVQEETNRDSVCSEDSAGLQRITDWFKRTEVSATEPSQIMRTLELRYGRTESIIDRALEDLRTMPVLGTSTAEVIDFAIKLQNITTIIAGIDRGAGYLHNPALDRQVSEKLTPHLQVHWCHYAERNKEDTRPMIIKMAEYLMNEADLISRHLRITSPTRRMSTPPKQPTPKATTSTPRRQTTDRGAAVYTAVKKSEQSTECLCCGAAHVTPKCKKLNDMSLSDRWQWAKTNKTCFQCMNSTHKRFKCKARKCGVRECRKSHHALLHPPEEPPKRQEDTAIKAAARLPENSQVLLNV